jgi:invasion protein IalB
MRIGVMKKTVMTALAVGAIALGASAAYAAVAQGQNQPSQQAQTPKGWSYQLDSRGNRVPKGNRVTNPDGSWREGVKQGNCVTVKEKSAAGEYKETRQCNPN